MKRENGVMKVELESGRELETRLLVGSDGNNSKVKELSGIPTFGWSHNQKAIVKNQITLIFRFVQLRLMLPL